MSKDFTSTQHATPSVGGNNFGEGKHRVRIKQIKHEQSKDPRKQGAMMWIVETEILESTCHKPGETRAWVQNRNHQPADGNIRVFVEMVVRPFGWSPQALAALKPEQYDALIRSWLLGPENPARGVICDVETTIIKTKSGGDFTRFTWLSAVRPDGQVAAVPTPAPMPAPVPVVVTAVAAPVPVPVPTPVPTPVPVAVPTPTPTPTA